MKNKVLILFLLITTLCCSQENDIENKIIIDKSIEEIVKSELSKSEDLRVNGLYIEYDPLIKPNILIDSIELKAIKKERNKENLNGLFSFYSKQNDSIYISGIPGIFLNNEGFLIKLKGDKFVTSAYFISNMIYSYSLNKSDKYSLSEMIEVPCENVKLILSEYPKLESNYLIYGYLEFETYVFYLNRQNFGLIESEEKTKHKLKMKVYFKSYYFD